MSGAEAPVWIDTALAGGSEEMSGAKAPVWTDTALAGGSGETSGAGANWAETDGRRCW